MARWRRQEGQRFLRKDDDSAPGSIGRNAEADLHREKRKNDTHSSPITIPHNLFFRKGAGKKPRLCQTGHDSGEALAQ